MNTTIRLYGEVEGTIWMPPAVCAKSFEIRLVRIPRTRLPALPMLIGAIGDI